MDQPLIRLEGVHKCFGDLEVLRGIDLEVRRSEVVVVIGPSGSGKSTMLRCINGLEPIQGGRIFIEGVDITSSKTDINQIRQKVGMVFQQFNLFPHKTALENLTLSPMKVQGKSRSEAEQIGQDLLAKVGLSEKADEYPGTLSGGQQQRVAIARALAMSPEVMLFDEATSALDPELVKGVLATIADLAGDGMTMLVVTHEMGFARGVADIVHFMDHGQVVESGPPEQLFEAASSRRLQEFLSQVL